MYWQIWFIVLVLTSKLCEINALSRQKLKDAGRLMKKSCMPKNQVTEEQIGKIEQGQFIEEKNVMCYIACIYSMTQVVKQNKLSYEAVIKQVDLMFPAEIKEAVKAAAAKCRNVAKSYSDLCEASYWTAKCMYEADPKNFIFP